jgi:hypothetical protein
MCTSAKKCLLSLPDSSLGCASARKLRLGQKRCTFGLDTEIIIFAFFADGSGFYAHLFRLPIFISY